MAIIFEYLILNNPSDADIITAGGNGWELVEVAGAKYIFKREIVV